MAELVELGAEKILQEGLEAEVDVFLGRGWYPRNDKEAPKGYRNGYTPKSFKTRSGTMRVQRPRLRDCEQPFASKLLEPPDDIEQSLKTLSVGMYTRGLSTRDIEATLTEPSGKPLVSSSEAGRPGEALYTEYARWRERDLSGYDVVYLFADGVYESIRSISGGQTILCVWGICSDGCKVLLAGTF